MELKVFAFARRLVETFVAQCGIRLDRLGSAWIGLAILSGVVGTAVIQIASPTLSTAYAIAMFAFYYLGNTLVLTRWSAGALALGGPAADRAWQRYEILVGLMFLNQGLGFSALGKIDLPGTRLAIDEWTAWTMGGGLVAVGVVTKTWATWVTGVDCYYYRDLFFRQRVWGFTRQGPYALFANPMYGVGNLQIYGFAILARSLPALAEAAFCSAAIYAFHFAIERPFVRSTLARPDVTATTPG